MSSFVLKIIAVIAMTIDHIGYAFFPKLSILRIIGRIAMPIFAFQIALGFKHSKNRKNYIYRMLAFSLISQIPFILMTSIQTSEFKLNIGFTFLFALLILYSLEEVKPIWGKMLCLVPIFIAAYFLNYDYYLFGISLVIIFYYTFKKPYIMIPLFVCAASIYSIYRNNILHAYSFLAILPFSLYNGKKGKGLKHFFYAYYPVHMIAIYLIFKLCL